LFQHDGKPVGFGKAAIMPQGLRATGMGLAQC
jgi:hypothetical protein